MIVSKTFGETIDRSNYIFSCLYKVSVAIFVFLNATGQNCALSLKIVTLRAIQAYTGCAEKVHREKTIVFKYENNNIWFFVFFSFPQSTIINALISPYNDVSTT